MNSRELLKDRLVVDVLYAVNVLATGRRTLLMWLVDNYTSSRRTEERTEANTKANRHVCRVAVPDGRILGLMWHFTLITGFSFVLASAALSTLTE